MPTTPANAYQPPINSSAAAIVFYELHNTLGESATDKLASEQVKKAILRFLSQSAALSGMKERDKALLTKAFRNVLGRSAVRHREGSLLVEALRRISETLNQPKQPENSKRLSAVSGSDADGKDWTGETSGLSQRHNS